jgi:hypothetical protein
LNVSKVVSPLPNAAETAWIVKSRRPILNGFVVFKILVTEWRGLFGLPSRILTCTQAYRTRAIFASFFIFRRPATTPSRTVPPE